MWGVQSVCVVLVGACLLVMVDAGYVGCFVGRDDPRLWDSLQGVKSCITKCARADRAFSAVWRNYCACSEDIGALEKDRDGCDFRCSDDSTMFCGGPNYRVSVYDRHGSGSVNGLPGYAWWLIGFGSLLIIVIILAVLKGICQKAKLLNRSDTYARDMAAYEKDIENAKNQNHIYSSDMSKINGLLPTCTEEEEDVPHHCHCSHHDNRDMPSKTVLNTEDQSEQGLVLQCDCSCHGDDSISEINVTKHPLTDAQHQPSHEYRPPPINPQHSIENEATPIAK